MAIIRILIDGYSLLHAWPDLARGKPRFSAKARDELIHVLTQYHDCIPTPITLFFDGSGAPDGTPKPVSSRSLEIIFSPAGRTADDLIERVAHLYRPYGEVLVVTDDQAERSTVTSLGGVVSRCEFFITEVLNTLQNQHNDLQGFNRREAEHFRRPRNDPPTN